MAALPALITVEQLYRMETPERCELISGRVVELAPPSGIHWRLQWRLVQLLGGALRGWGEVGMEFPFRPVAQFERWIADVGACSRERWKDFDVVDNLRGAPDLVIEVRSVSNTRRYFRQRASLCLVNGCQAFWIVDQDAQTITVLTADGSSMLYQSGDSVPLIVVSGELPVSEIFASER